MAKVYTLKEPQYVRDDVAMNVALLRYMRFFSNGVEVNPLSAEDAARYDAILEKIGAGVPLAEIAELQQVLQEIEKAEERRRVFREFRNDIAKLALNSSRSSGCLRVTKLSICFTCWKLTRWHQTVLLRSQPWIV